MGNVAKTQLHKGLYFAANNWTTRYVSSPSIVRCACMVLNVFLCYCMCALCAQQQTDNNNLLQITVKFYVALLVVSCNICLNKL